jgi:N-methylhydantoinase A/oxoprolinase/acetone carboxylase beta subunit
VGGFVPTAVHRRDDLVPGAVVTGPAIIEEGESTTVVPPGDTCVADEFGNLRISIGEGGNLP